jgi:hypothetical protein
MAVAPVHTLKRVLGETLRLRAHPDDATAPCA